MQIWLASVHTLAQLKVDWQPLYFGSGEQKKKPLFKVLAITSTNAHSV